VEETGILQLHHCRKHCNSTGMRGVERPNQNKPASPNDWRRYGESRRQLLVEQDEANTSFYLNPACPIARYFELAERVSCDISEKLLLTSIVSTAWGAV
jgi:hypothetical protein